MIAGWGAFLVIPGFGAAYLPDVVSNEENRHRSKRVCRCLLGIASEYYDQNHRQRYAYERIAGVFGDWGYALGRQSFVFGEYLPGHVFFHEGNGNVYLVLFVWPTAIVQAVKDMMFQDSRIQVTFMEQLHYMVGLIRVAYEDGY